MRHIRNQFRTIALAEAVSYLLLLGIAVPMKYMLGNPLPVKYLGWAHGVLFILYNWWMIRLREMEEWGWKKTFRYVAAALLPLGPMFMFDKEEH